MPYRIERIEEERPPFAPYRYRILKNEKLIARYEHDYRGEEHTLELINGQIKQNPIGRITDFLKGGGPTPLTLSPKAIQYLNQQTKKPTP